MGLSLMSRVRFRKSPGGNVSFRPVCKKLRLFGDIAGYDSGVEWQNLADWDILGGTGRNAWMVPACTQKTFPLDLNPLTKRGIAMELVRKLWSEEQGQDIAEYAVMLAVILVIVVGTVRLIGSNANNVFSTVASSIQ